MQEFLINKNSTLPYLEMEVIKDGRNSYKKAYMALQAATVTFSMTNLETGIKKIANAKAYVVSSDVDTCDEGVKIQYRWQKRDTNEAGQFVGQFKIVFDNDVIIDGETLPKGEMIVPISEDLIINISDGLIRTI